MTSPAFALNALIYLASLVILWFGLKEMPSQKGTTNKTATPKETLSHYWEILSHPRVAGFVPAWIAVNAVLGIWINLTARVLTDKGRFSGQLLAGAYNSQQAGLVYAGFMGIFVTGILIWSLISHNMKKITAMLIGVVGLFGACLVLFLINLQPTFNEPLIIPLVIVLAISMMVMSGFTPSALAHLADITEHYSADRGAIMGLYSVFLGLGQFIGSAIGGPFVDWLGANGMVLATTLLGVVATLLLLRLQGVERQSGKTEQQDAPQTSLT